MTDDTPKPWTGIGAMAEVATTMMRAAFTLPLGAMRAACDLQERVIEIMEVLVPGVSPETRQPSGDISQPPAVSGSVSASSTPGTTGATTGWGPVTQQDPVTGWGPMPR